MQPVDLKQVAEEIKAIFKKHDIGGYFVLHESHLNTKSNSMDGNSEFVFVFDPSYSLISIEDENVVRIRGTAKELGSAEARNRKLAATDNLLLHLNKTLTDAISNVRKLYAMFTHRTGGFDHYDH